VEALAFAVAVPALVHLGLPRLESIVTVRRWRPRVVPIERVVACVDVAIRFGHPIVRPGCLVRGLTRYYFLNRAHEDVALSFGIGQVDEQFAGHCWLVRDGEPFLETRDPRPVFRELYRFAGRASSMPV
jgi:hypothetical protein